MMELFYARVAIIHVQNALAYSIIALIAIRGIIEFCKIINVCAYRDSLTII